MTNQGNYECLDKLTNKDIYNILIYKKKIIAHTFNAWKKKFCLENAIGLRASLNFIFECLEENKLKMFRWKLFMCILPCKKQLFTWKLEPTPLCTVLVCDMLEDYDHFFISCKHVQTFWNKVTTVFIKMKIEINLANIKYAVIGYKTGYPAYNDLHVLLSYIFFSIYKSYFISEKRTKIINIFNVLVQELTMYKCVRKFRRLRSNTYIGDFLLSCKNP